MSDDFFNNSITSIAQTPDGYLWLGTEFGLLRLDGVRAVPWQPPNQRFLNLVGEFSGKEVGAYCLNVKYVKLQWHDDNPRSSGIRGCRSGRNIEIR